MKKKRETVGPMMKEFREFTSQTKASELILGIIIWNFGSDVIYSLVDDLIMPSIGIFLGNAGFSDIFVTLKEGLSPAPYASLEAAAQAGAITLNLGRFISRLISFALLGLCVCAFIKHSRFLKSFLNSDMSETKRKCCECDAVVSSHNEKCPHCNASP